MTKRILLTIVISLLRMNSFSCDEQLQNNPNTAITCEIQDKYQELKNVYTERNLNINSVLEYRAIRFIDRASWESSVKFKKNYDPKYIYDPAPITWDIWNNGVLKYENDESLNIVKTLLGEKALEQMNRNLLSDGKNDIAYGSHNAGEMRTNMFDANVGFCVNGSLDDVNYILNESKNSLDTYFKEWEKKAGITLKSLAKKYHDKDYKKIDLAIELTNSKNLCADKKSYFVNYPGPSAVKKYLKWITYFLDYNMNEYDKGNLISDPLELASIFQKVFVSIHPFNDGNGRTSRLLQDLILKKYNLPFAPAGDLQSDVLGNASYYIEKTKTRMISMLTFLENCQNGHFDEERQKRCEAYDEL